MAEDPGQIREAIDETRAEIAETMQALGEKADVKGRVTGQIRSRSEELKAQAAESADQLRQRFEVVAGQAKSALPDSAAPRADAAVERARTAASTIAGDPELRRRAMMAGAVVVLLVLVRRRRHR